MICFVSGYGATIEGLSYVTAMTFASCGYDVFQYDHRNQGRSAGLWMAFEDFDLFVRDGRDIFAMAKRRWGSPDMGYFLLGSSMGGAVSLYLSMEEDYEALPREDEIVRWNGLILMAPLVQVDPARVPSRFALEFMDWFLVPFMPRVALVPMDDLRSFCTRMPEVLEWMEASPVRYTDGVRPITGRTMIRAAETLETKLDRVLLPLLILHGDADKVTRPECSQHLYEKARSKDKTLKMYEGAYHILFSDYGREQVFDDVCEWIEARRGHAVFRQSRSQLLTHKEKKEMSMRDLLGEVKAIDEGDE
jgi:acylglycerol lipase